MNGRAEVTGVADEGHGDKRERIGMPQHILLGDHNWAIGIAEEGIQLGYECHDPHAWANLLRLANHARSTLVRQVVVACQNIWHGPRNKLQGFFAGVGFA